MISIRRFLVVILLAAITLINFLAALQGYRTSMTRAEQLFDEQIMDVAAVLAATSAGSAAVADGIAPADRPGGIVFQVWRGGTLQLASLGAPAEPLAPLTEGFADANFSGYRWRTFARYEASRDRWLLVAERADMRFALAENVILEAVVPIIVGLPLVALLIWVIVGRGLGPLRGLAGEMAAKRSDDLSPVPAEGAPAELAALIDSINSLLHRLELAFERERRFAADAAHELRTPISVLKVQLHNLLNEAQDANKDLLALQPTVKRIEHSVEQVLMLYRTAPEQFPAHFEELDMAGLVRETVAGLYPQLEVRRQQVEVAATPALLQGDRFALQTLLTNLIENASKYGGAGGEIRVTVRPDGDAVLLKVEDSGPGIPPEQRQQVLERFYRGVHVRNDAAIPGSGIGLAIVRHVADIHGAELELGDADFPTGLAVTLRLPCRHEVQRSE